MSLWDEKNLTKWSHLWLEKAFETKEFTLVYPEGDSRTCTLSFFESRIQGDVSMHQTKTSGKPRPVFELDIDLDFKCELVIDAGRAMVDLKGEMRVVDFNSEDYEDCAIKVFADPIAPDGAEEEVWKNLSSKLESAVKKDGVMQVRKFLCTKFINAMIKKSEKPEAKAKPEEGA